MTERIGRKTFLKVYFLTGGHGMPEVGQRKEWDEACRAPTLFQWPVTPKLLPFLTAVSEMWWRFVSHSAHSKPPIFSSRLFFRAYWVSASNHSPWNASIRESPASPPTDVAATISWLPADSFEHKFQEKNVFLILNHILVLRAIAAQLKWLNRCDLLWALGNLIFSTAGPRCSHVI